MKSTALLLLALCPAAPLAAQGGLFPLRETADSLRFRAAVSGGRLALEPVGAAPSGFLSGIKLDDADLLATCRAERRGAKSPTRFSLSLRPEGGEATSPEPGLLIDPGEKSGAALRQIVWQDFTELRLVPGRQYTLAAVRTELGWVDCAAPRPVFSLKKRLPYYAAAAASAAMLGSGQFFYAKKREDYRSYRRLWADEATKAEAQPFFDGAKKAERTAQVLTAAGLGLLAADAFFFMKKWRSVRARQRTHDRFCGGEGLSWRAVPFVEGPFAAGRNAPAAGAGILLSF